VVSGALLSYVEEVNAGGDVKDATFAELNKRFTPEEILELTIVTVHYYGAGLLTRSLQLKPEEDEPLFIGPRRLCRSKNKSPAAQQGFSAIGLLGGRSEAQRVMPSLGSTAIDTYTECCDKILPNARENLSWRAPARR
jgi:hypothetical protein